MKQLLAITIAIIGMINPLHAQESDSKQNKSMEFISRFEGTWHCEGAFFKNNKSIKATTSFNPILENKAIKFEQTNFPPNDFHATGLWSFDEPGETLTNLAVYTNPGTQRALSNFFVGEIIDSSTMTFTADTLAAPPFRKHRYLYKIESEDKYRAEWQIFEKAKWKSIDYLNCQRIL